MATCRFRICIWDDHTTKPLVAEADIVLIGFRLLLLYKMFPFYGQIEFLDIAKICRIVRSLYHTEIV